MDMSGISSAKDDCIQEYVRILNAKSYSLAEIFCKDAFGGNEILKVIKKISVSDDVESANRAVLQTLALCCLNFLVGFGNRSELSTRLAANGHLQNFTDSLEADDGKLQIVLTRPTESLRPLYVYTARMVSGSS